tara:strand:- start:1221 stop:1373 length:153 start_codon:yes stop_codon:yes gene_type:complete
MNKKGLFKKLHGLPQEITGTWRGWIWNAEHVKEIKELLSALQGVGVLDIS